MSFKEILIVGVGLILATAVLAQPQATPLFPKLELTDGHPYLAKAASHLLQARLLAKQGRSTREVHGLVPLVKFTDGLAVIEVRLEELTPAILEQIKQIGMQVSYASFRWARVDGLLDLDLLDQIAALPEVSTIHPNYGYTTWGGACSGGTGGSTCSQGDASIRAEDGRSTYGVDGTGVTVGLMSDSFNFALGGSVSGGTCLCDTPGSTCSTVVTGMTNQVSGDLPASVPLLDDCTAGSPACDVLDDEGAAQGEIVHDLAPGADLMFHSASNGIADFADGITELKNCGADVIVDDIAYFAEPMFQDGIIAQAAQDAVDMNVSFFSAAGNLATFGIDDVYADSDPMDDEDFPPTGDDLHDFLPGSGFAPGGGPTRGVPQSFARITIPVSPDPMCGPGEEQFCCGIVAVLQWNEPFDGTGPPTSSGAGLGPGAFDDLDLYLYPGPSVAGPPLAFSTSLQGCSFGPMAPPSGDPLELLVYFNTGVAPLDTFLAVENFCGDQDQRMRVATFATGPCELTSPIGDYEFEDGIDQSTGGAAGETPIFVDAQIYGHRAAAGVLAVAAADYREIDSGGTFQDGAMTLDVEPFSSLGGDLPFFFGTDGGPLPVGPGPIGRDPHGPRGPTAPETRFKPEITAPDGTNNTFFGIDTDSPPDGFPNFPGTSASAPHAAAVAALMQELGNLTPSGLAQIIEQSTFDFEDPGTDFLSGFGLIDALGGIGTTAPSSASCFIDDLQLEGKPATGTQTIRACNSFTASAGNFEDIIGIADEIIFGDGFESGDTSAWGPP